MLSAYGLYTHIRANEIRSRLLLAGLFVLVLLVTFGLLLMAGASDVHGSSSLQAHLKAAAQDLVWGAPLAAAITIAWCGISFRAHQGMIDMTVGARPVALEEAPDLYRLLEPLCISRGIRVPTLRIADDDALNAYATGLESSQYSITVTRGLVAALGPREMQAVLGHELTHIRNGDVRTMVIAMVVTGIIGFVAELLFRSRFFWGGTGRGSDKKDVGSLPALLIGRLLILLAWALSQAIRFALSRTREFVADAGAVELTKDPDAMISALLKIADRGELARAPSGIMEMCLDNPRNGFVDLFATHPTIDDRVRALETYAGGHRPARAGLDASRRFPTLP